MITNQATESDEKKKTRSKKHTFANEEDLYL